MKVDSIFSFKIFTFIYFFSLTPLKLQQTFSKVHFY